MAVTSGLKGIASEAVFDISGADKVLAHVKEHCWRKGRAPPFRWPRPVRAASVTAHERDSHIGQQQRGLLRKTVPMRGLPPESLGWHLAEARRRGSRKPVKVLVGGVDPCEWEGVFSPDSTWATVLERVGRTGGRARLTVGANWGESDWGGEGQWNLSVWLFVPQGRVRGRLEHGDLFWAVTYFYPISPPRNSWAGEVVNRYLAETAVYTAWEHLRVRDGHAVFQLSEQPREHLDPTNVSFPMPALTHEDQVRVALSQTPTGHERFLNALVDGTHRAAATHLFPPDSPPSPWGGVISEIGDLRDSERLACSVSHPTEGCYHYIRPVTEMAEWDWGEQPLHDKWAIFETAG